MKLPYGKRIHGLKNATGEEIAVLKKEFPNGYHKVQFSSGKKLPHNGVFFETKPRSKNK